MESNTSKIKLISYFSNFISLIGSILTILSFYGFYDTKKITYIIVAIVLLISTIVLFFFRYKISKGILVFLMNKTIPNSNKMIIDKEVVYEHLTRDKYSFKSSFSIKIIGNETINSHDEYIKWTAGFISNIQPIRNNQKIEYDKNPTAYNNIDKQKFTILFPNGMELSKSDSPYKTGFKIPELIDNKHIAKPILVVGIYDITKNLTLKVYFNENLNPIEPRGLKYAHFIDNVPYDTIKLTKKYDDEKNMHYVEFCIKKPIYGGKYAVDWSFND